MQNFRVESFVSVHQEDKGVSLICPDAPMVQIGNFNFARKSNSIPREQNPLLLAWPLNNYWDTNFRASQPGYIELNYLFRSHDKFDPVVMPTESKRVTVPVEVHPLINCQEEKTQQFFSLSNSDFHVLHVKKSEDNQGIIFRIINRGKKESEGTLAVPSKKIINAHICSVLEEDVSSLKVIGNSVNFQLQSNQLSTIKLIIENT